MPDSKAEPPTPRIIHHLGEKILRFNNVPSTNDLALGLANAGEEEGTVVLARAQTAGRGRMGRSWSSADGEGLYLSIILRPTIHAARAPLITLAAAVAIAETLMMDFDAAPDIKWPNDVMVGNKKICGILVEAATEREQISFAILGIGVNLLQRSFPNDLAETATSLVIETGRAVSAEDFLARFLDRMACWYQKCETDPPSVIAEWQQLSTWAHCRAVRVIAPDGEFEGVTRGLTDQGALIVELDNGERRRFFSAELTLRPAVKNGSLTSSTD